ncbi:hypothetical protein AB6F62_16695 [Providencia huaxiensis]|uniref:hypothetical protein n=1 Tax=Providencia huaxiensis TaxID=2027290 RepID=UPI0034DCD901
MICNESAAPTYKAVPLPLPMAGGESGMFQFPLEGTLVEIAFEAAGQINHLSANA